MSATASLACLVGHLEPYHSLVNTSMVEFIVSDLFSTLPDDVQTELLAMNDEQIAAIPTKLIEDEDDNTAVGDVVAGLRKHSLELLGLVREVSPGEGEDVDMVQSLDRIMPQKKMHEVCQMSKFVADLTSAHEVASLVDIGSGKGYLSQLLAAWYKIPVLAIDNQMINTEGADRRGKNLAKRWEGLVVRAEERNEGKNPSNWKQRRKNMDNCAVKAKDGGEDTLLVNLTQFVESGSDCGTLVQEHLGCDTDNFGIIGLHTCGDLAAASIRTFLSSPGAKILCNVGCCYRPLTEQFSFFQGNPTSLLYAGFPLSSYLKCSEYSLGRLARTLAAQPLSRLASTPCLPDKSLLWRAVLQVIAARVAPDLTWQQMKVGNIATKSDNFLKYARGCFEKIGVDICLSDQEISELYQEEDNKFGKKLNAFYQFRALFAPLVESIILVDRLVFLEEDSSVKDCYLVKMFDSNISPRSYAVVATKL